MTNLSKVSQDEVSKNQVIRSNVAKTQQPDAERLTYVYRTWKLFTNLTNFSYFYFYFR